MGNGRTMTYDGSSRAKQSSQPASQPSFFVDPTTSPCSSQARYPTSLAPCHVRSTNGHISSRASVLQQRLLCLHHGFSAESWPKHQRREGGQHPRSEMDACARSLSDVGEGEKGVEGGRGASWRGNRRQNGQERGSLLASTRQRLPMVGGANGRQMPAGGKKLDARPDCR
ncbi:uncharacterized protein BKA78DRAFT_118863 [Phyllosticta capitalensis]|uniref:uncharacterized protein n=1 Tax=Phyllosticta capitalensis TaxID=121624 RepID=UPI00312F5E97